MNGPFAELHDYDALRTVTVSTAMVGEVAGVVVVVGSSQPAEILRPDAVARRRRGGGGAVLLQPGDAWIDLWFPTGHEITDAGVTAGAVAVGQMWRAALVSLTSFTYVVHDRADEVDPALRLACFASVGAGEITCAARKVVGITQWRVREGVLFSTVVHARPSISLVDELVTPPPALGDRLATHATLESLGLQRRRHELIDAVVDRSGAERRFIVTL